MTELTENNSRCICGYTFQTEPEKQKKQLCLDCWPWHEIGIALEKVRTAFIGFQAQSEGEPKE